MSKYLKTFLRCVFRKALLLYRCVKESWLSMTDKTGCESLNRKPCQKRSDSCTSLSDAVFICQISVLLYKFEVIVWMIRVSSALQYLFSLKLLVLANAILRRISAMLVLIRYTPLLSELDFCLSDLICANLSVFYGNEIIAFWV